jgi:hypothetical protein
MRRAGKAKRPQVTAVSGLEPHQERALMRHLSDGYLELKEIDRLAFAIRCYWPEVQASILYGSEVREQRTVSHRHFAKMAAHARGLQEALSAERPLVNTCGVDWAGFDAALKRVLKSAEMEVEASQPRRGRGRRPEEWRDELVAVVYAHYPETKAKLAEESHFEKTVALLLRFLAADVEDVHGLIVDARRRRPKSPQLITRV